MKKQYKINFIIGSTLVGIIFALIIIGYFYTPFDPNEMNPLMKNMPPNFKNLLGTDNFGRDILSRVIEGAGTTFIIAIATIFISCTIGILVGSITGYYGGIIDSILMRVNDAFMAFPSILVALVIVSVIGIGKYQITAALSIVFIPSFTRVVRSEFIALKERDFVYNAKLMGASDVRILFLHILPNAKVTIKSAITVGLNNAILAEAGMSYLGLGVQPPDASLGRMLAEAQTYLFNAPWYALAPGFVIVFTILGLSLLSETER